METLQNTLISLISKDYEIKDLELILGPAAIYANNQIFNKYVKDIINIITKDRNGNQKFDIGDLELLSKDILGITALVTSILLILNTLPNVKFEYREGATEELVFKIIVYIFLVVLPRHTNIKLTLEEKMAILNLCLLVYTFLIESQIVKQLVKKVLNWAKLKCFSCIATGRGLLERKFPKLETDMILAIRK